MRQSASTCVDRASLRANADETCVDADTLLNFILLFVLLCGRSDQTTPKSRLGDKEEEDGAKELRQRLFKGSGKGFFRS